MLSNTYVIKIQFLKTRRLLACRNPGPQFSIHYGITKWTSRELARVSSSVWPLTGNTVAWNVTSQPITTFSSSRCFSFPSSWNKWAWSTFFMFAFSITNKWPILFHPHIWRSWSTCWMGILNNFNFYPFSKSVTIGVNCQSQAKCKKEMSLPEVFWDLCNDNYLSCNNRPEKIRKVSDNIM